jgi:hypothetical protein
VEAPPLHVSQELSQELQVVPVKKYLALHDPQLVLPDQVQVVHAGSQV